MPRPRSTDLVDYRDFLQQRGIADSTARTYESLVRRILKDVPTITGPSLTAFLYGQVQANSRSSVKVAWHYYAEFRRQDAQEILPEFGTLTRTGAEAVGQTFQAPPFLRTALQLLVERHGATVGMLANGYWRDVSLVMHKGLPCILLNVRDRKYTGCIFPRDLIQPFLRWAAPETHKPFKDQPFIPLTEGGTVQVNPLALRSALQHAEALTESREVTSLGAVFDLEEAETQLRVAGPLQDVKSAPLELPGSPVIPASPAPEAAKTLWALPTGPALPLSTREVEDLIFKKS